MPGVFIVSDQIPIGDAIEEILMFVACSEQEEWQNRVMFLPL